MKKSLVQEAQRVGEAIREDVIRLDESGMVVVKAPPGAGKTYLLLQLLQSLHKNRRVAVACFTNAQADDICRRCATDHPGLRVIRYLSKNAPGSLSGVQEITSGSAIPSGPCVVVANTSKWALAKNPEFDYLLVDEAWQIAWADLMLLRNLAGRVVLIGDPGQIPPIVSIETERWETSRAAPHRPAPEHFIGSDSGIALHALPGSRRLPSDTVDLVRNFYDFAFAAFAEPGERFVLAKGDSSPIGQTISTLAERSIASLVLPTPDSGPPVEIDDELARTISDLVVEILEQESTFSDGEASKARPTVLKPEHIGIVATHRSMNTRIANRLPAKLRQSIKVDTTERWQGLERKLMIAVHPLSSTPNPSAFDLETGRLCVMASRHQCGLIVVSRDHVRDTLESHIPTADQPLSRPDATGRGLAGHRSFWSTITS